MLTATGAPAQGSEAEQGQRLGQPQSLFVSQSVHLTSRVALSASLALVTHIHTPPLHEKGGYGPSTQAPGSLRAATGERRGGQPIMSEWVI